MMTVNVVVIITMTASWYKQIAIKIFLLEVKSSKDCHPTITHSGLVMNLLCQAIN